VEAAGVRAGTLRLVYPLHRWFAKTLAERLTDRVRALDSLLD
jgi:hypothetical protein